MGTDLHSGLDELSYIQGELIRSLDRTRLVHRLGIVDSQTSSLVAEVVTTLLSY